MLHVNQNIKKKMDTVESASLVVGLETLVKWSEMEIPEYSPPVVVKDSPFPCLPHLNEKLRVSDGNGLNLDVMALVHPTSESLKESTPFTEELYQKAGPDLMREVEAELFNCRTGDAKLSKGYDLPARYIIHTVGPRYNIKYKTAAESALYNCYRQTLLLAKENHITSLAMGAIHTARRSYPPEEGAHIAIRTLRRMLEKHGDAFEAIVLTIHGIDESLYPDLLRLYFPRNKQEEQWAVDLLPDDIGNEEGEPVIPERQIRITGDPTGRLDGDDSNNSSPVSEQSPFDSDEINARGHAFTSIEKDPDAIKAENMKKRRSEEPSDFDLRHRYERLLRKARTEDLSDFAAHRCVYQSGVDIFDRPIIVFVARNFPATTVNLGKALLYIIHLLDPIVSQDYVIVYFHTLCTSANQPSFSWLKSVYNSLDSRYRQNLKSFYVVHPTFWSKLLIWYFTTFTAGRIKEKVQMCNSVHYLYKTIHPDQLDVPPFVLEHDMKQNPIDYRDDENSDGGSNSL